MLKTKLKDSIGLIARGANHLLWPALCQNCGCRMDDEWQQLCPDCWGQLTECSSGDFCRRCGIDTSAYALLADSCPRCVNSQFTFDRIVRAGVYRGTLRSLIIAFKLSGRTELAPILGFLTRSALQSAQFYHDIELIVPVPVHWRTRISRGYSHTSLLSGRLNHPTARVCPDLRQIRRTKPQPAMPSSTARVRNVAGAFAVRRDHRFKNRNVCLIDDVKTTGATLNECAKTLKQAGAKKVYAVVLAVAGQDRN